MSLENRISVAVVGAETPGNVGTIARAMKNFGVTDLFLVDPPTLDPDGEAYGFAGHAREDVLPDAREVEFDFLVEQFHTVGCTAVTNQDGSQHVRYPYSTPSELATRLRGVDGETCVVFGRESTGLSNAELARLDEICAIPASEDYPVLNLGQAATVVLYELRAVTLSESQLPAITDRADHSEIEGLHGEFAAFVDALGHPEEKFAKTRRMWRRLLGRADPTGREVQTLRGLFRRGAACAREARSNLDAGEDTSRSSTTGSGDSADGDLPES